MIDKIHLNSISLSRPTFSYIELRYSSFSLFSPKPTSLKGCSSIPLCQNLLKSQPIVEVLKLEKHDTGPSGWHCALVGVIVVWDLALSIVSSKT